MFELSAVLFLVLLMVINLAVAKICWDFIPKTEDRGHKIRAGLGVFATLSSALVCVIYLVLYFLL